MSSTRRDWLKGAGNGVLLLAAGLPSVAHAVPETVTVIVGRGFGTTWSAVMPVGADPAIVRTCIDSIIKTVGRAVSPFDLSSELSRFNAVKHTRWVGVSTTFEAVVAESLRVAAITGGAFEPTVGPLVHRFGFGPISNGAAGTYTDIAVHAGMISKARPDLTLDPCGIAKGYALDLMGKALRRLGHADFLIEFGGEIISQGAHPLGRAWQVGIERPVSGPAVIQRIIRLDGMCLATSGDKVNAFEVAGRRYSHIVDPITARPKDNSIASVSVLAPTAMEADAFATALMVMGCEHGVDFAVSHKIPALFLWRDGSNIRELAAAGFAHYMQA